MRHRTVIPDVLGRQFSVRAAADAGVGRGRRDAADLARPFHGIRAVEVPETFRARVDCIIPRLRGAQRLAGRTAARLWGLPLPWRWQCGEDIAIAVPTGTSPPRTVGVQGIRLHEQRLTAHRVGGAVLLDPIATLFTCAAELTVDQAVVMMDAIITTSQLFPGLAAARPFVMPDDIDDRLTLWGRFPGCAKMRSALELAREGVESPKETETRVLLVRAGLPEPVVQYEVFDHLRFVARVDLAYPQQRIAIEYEGDGHRTDPAQWRRDIQRQRELEALGWTVIRLTEVDLNEPEALVRRIRSVLA